MLLTDLLLFPLKTDILPRRWNLQRLGRMFCCAKEQYNGAQRQVRNAKRCVTVLFDKLELAYSISVRMVNTSGRLKISFFKNNG